jgi:histone H3/H4
MSSAAATPTKSSVAAAAAAAASDDMSIPESDSGSGAEKDRATTPALPDAPKKAKKLKGASATGPAPGKGRRHTGRNKLKATPRKISGRRWKDFALTGRKALGVYKTACPLFQEDFDASLALIATRAEILCRGRGRKTIGEADVRYAVFQAFGIKSYQDE